MSRCNALISLSLPGLGPQDREGYRVLNFWREVFEGHLGVSAVEEVDTVAGWGCPNQDWLEVTCEIETSWEWCRPICLTADEWATMWDALSRGRLLMMVHYKKDDGSFEPYW